MFSIRSHIFGENCTQELHDQIKGICTTARSLEEIICRWVSKGHVLELTHMDFAPDGILAMFNNAEGETLIGLEWDLAEIRRTFPQIEPVSTETLFNADEGGLILDDSWIDTRNARIGARWLQKQKRYDLNPHFLVETTLSYCFLVGGLAKFTQETPTHFERQIEVGEDNIVLEATYFEPQKPESCFQERFVVPKRRLASRAKRLRGKNPLPIQAGIPVQ